VGTIWPPDCVRAVPAGTHNGQVEQGSTAPTHIVLMHPNGKARHEVWKVSDLTNIPTR
jgi:hypothetical protein